MSNLKRKLDNPRELDKFEKSIITKMISYLPNGDILKTQMYHTEVVSVCDCGCRTVDLKVPTDLERYSCNRRVPVEMIVEFEGELPPILFQIHVIDGLLNELEILNLDSSPILNDIDITKGVIEVRI